MSGTEVLLFGLYGLALLLVVWPTTKSARKVLQRWRVAEPTDDQVVEVLSYLRRRRFWYPWLLLVAPFVMSRFGSSDGGGGGASQVLVAVLTALLIAELLALRPTRAAVRAASLMPRGLFDLVPRWAVACYGVLIVLTAGFGTAGVVVQAWVNDFVSTLGPNGEVPTTDGSTSFVNSAEQLADGRAPWVHLGATALCLIAVGAVVWLAKVRPGGADVVVDGVLRTRSARVALGLGIALQGALAVDALQRIARIAGYVRYGAPPWTGVVEDWTGWFPVVVWLGSILAWIWVANPPAKVRLVAGTDR